MPGEEGSRAICGDGLIQSPIISVGPCESTSWATEITLLAQGYFELGIIVQEVLKGDITDLGRRWSSDPCYVRSGVVNQSRK